MNMTGTNDWERAAKASQARSVARRNEPRRADLGYHLARLAIVLLLGLGWWVTAVIVGVFT